MTPLSPWGFVALILAPAIHAEALPFVRGRRLNRLTAVSGALAPLIIGISLVSRFYTSPDRELGGLYGTLTFGHSGQGLHFGVDALNAPLLPLLSLLTFAVVLGGPSELRRTLTLRELLWKEAGLLLTLTTQDLAVLAVAWTAVLLPGFRPTGESTPQSRSMSRIFALYQGFGALSFIAGCAGLVYYAHPGGLFDMSLVHLDAAVVPEGEHLLLFWLLTIGALVRMSIVPFHSWAPWCLEGGTGLGLMLLMSARTGLYVLARLAVPAFSDAAQRAGPVLIGLAIVSSVYGALGALAQRDLRRMVGFLIISQSGVMLTGIVLGDSHAVSGTLLYWLGFATATTGLLLSIAALHARTGSADMRKFGGLVRQMPHLSASFFLFALASIAIPGSVAFAAEDMLVHGVLEAHPMLTMGIILATVLNAICLVRAYTTTFLGERHFGALELGGVRDLLPRERVATVILLVTLFAAGLFPAPLVEVQTPAARWIYQLEHSAPTPLHE